MSKQRVRIAGAVIAACVALIVACEGGGEESTPDITPTQTVTPSASPTQTATPTPTVSEEAQREEVREAYLAYWNAYAAAVLELDITLVEDFAAGDELEGIRQEIEQLRADGVALRVVVEHDPEVTMESESVALVADRIVDNSFYVDAETKDPPQAEGSGETHKDLVRMERIDGRWLVTGGAREQGD